MITGREALSSIEQAISQTRSNEGRLDGALQSAMAEAERLRAEEAEGFRLLARIRLDAMVRNEVIGNIDASERRALDMIQKHRQTIETLARRRDELQAELSKAEQAKGDRDQALAKPLDELDQLRHRTQERIKADTAWQAAKAAVDAAEKVAANADQKAALAESDLAAKGKPYEDDPLFIYLWRRKHGQADDRSGFLARFFDRKVALLAGYQDARANYAMLQEIPARLREHAKGKLAGHEAAKARLVEVERGALVAAGVEAVEARVERAQAARKTAEEAVTKATAELAQIDGERQRAIGVDENAAMAGAIDVLAREMERDDLKQLYQEALRTPSKEDERAVGAISRAREALRKAEAEVAEIRGEIRQFAQRRGELEGARDRARRVGYDNPGGMFGGQGQADLSQVIGGILGGVLRGAALDSILRDNYRAPQRRADPGFGGGYAGPAGDSWPGPSHGGGGSSDEGWSTGGRF